MSPLLSRALTLLTVALLLASAAIGVLGGVRLGELASKPGTRTFEVSHPDAPSALTLPGSASAPVGPPARVTPGFSGFGGAPALRGDVLRVGTVQSVTPTELLLTSEGSTVTIRYTGADRFFRLAPAASRDLRPGQAVQLLVTDERVTGVLKLPVGLDQGSNR